MNQFGSAGDILTMLRRRMAVILVIAGIGCALSVYAALQQPKVYEASAVVQLEDAQVIDARTGLTDAAHTLQLIEQRMMARDNLIEIIEDYDLFADTDLSLALKVVQLRENARLTEINDNAQPWTPNANPTGLIINVTLNDPQEAADVANELLARVVAQGTSRQLESARETLTFFRAQEAEMAREIAALDEAIAEFKQTNAGSLPAAVGVLRTQLVDLSQTDLELERQMIQLENDRRPAREGVVEAQMALLQEQRDAVRERSRAIEEAIAAAPQVEQELGLMERRMLQLQDQYSVVTRKLAEAETTNTLESNRQTERFEVLETALVPEHAVSRSSKKTAIMGGALSVLLGIGAAILLEVLNPAIRTARQLENALGIQAVISIPTVQNTVDRRYSAMRIAMITGLLAALGVLVYFMQEAIPGFGLQALF